ncbi:hypothetical protein [Sphingomonas sp. Leaf10]|uniref:hypothetical protein n=1 Tax=Sphingomonas sp. Leaf10 TaxID=1735676 RepID=UPI0006F7EE89|nr:hypothetical protein [Sphingomonas sp. Leaf10]KQM37983.1 hypothetical protein ASE59_11840 [Sphingomonas sp. Leaf10]
MDNAHLFLHRLIECSVAIGWQAGVGGRETAGAIVSYLAVHPERLQSFIDCNENPFDWGEEWIKGGVLTWQTKDGRIIDPADLPLPTPPETNA